MKTATIITIGDEILSGNTIDTNSNFIAQQLKDVGIKVKQIFTISDEINTIEQFLEVALRESDLIITTGGLGPTKDDKTKQAYANFFKDEIVFSEELYGKLGRYLEKEDARNYWNATEVSAKYYLRQKFSIIIMVRRHVRCWKKKANLHFACPAFLLK